MDFFARPSQPTGSTSPAAPLADPPAHLLASPSGAPAPGQTDETPGMRRAMAVVASEYPHMTYGQRRLLVRAVLTAGDREPGTALEDRIRAAYTGTAIETTPSSLINPTPMDWTALWLSMQPMHVFRAYVAEMLAAVRTHGEGTLSREQTRLWSVYRKAQSELGTEEGK